MMKIRLSWFVLAALCMATAALQAQVTKESVPGVTNFSRVETTIACAGATTPAAVAGLRKMGFASIVNLRQATEPGADVEGEAAAAAAAGINYVHLPFNAAAPDPAVVDRFLAAVIDPRNQPAFVHCATANRAAVMWFIKRVKVDKWDVDRASAEATALGLTSSPLKAFALDYLAAHTPSP
jgi:uncharacterized protein (TIGR01244 family)